MEWLKVKKKTIAVRPGRLALAPSLGGLHPSRDSPGGDREQSVDALHLHDERHPPTEQTHPSAEGRQPTPGKRPTPRACMYVQFMSAKVATGIHTAPREGLRAANEHRRRHEPILCLACLAFQVHRHS